MQRCIRQIIFCCAGDAHAGEVKVIDAAGSKVELLYEHKLRRQLGHIRRNIIAGRVQVPVAAEPHKVAACISVRAGQAIGRRRGKTTLVIFHNDLNILRAAAQFAAAKVKGNGFQSVRPQCVRVQDFKYGAEPVVRDRYLSTAVVPAAVRTAPTKRTLRRKISRSILPPRMHPFPVFDISVVLVQYPVPFIALRRAAI